MSANENVSGEIGGRPISCIPQTEMMMMRQLIHLFSLMLMIGRTNTDPSVCTDQFQLKRK